MEAFFLIVIIALLVRAEEREHVRLLFPNQPCALCPLEVRWENHRWIHENGRVRMPLGIGAYHDAVPAA